MQKDSFMEHAKINLALIFFICSNSLFGQYIGFQKIEHKDVSEWLPYNIEDYEGVYHFGESEGESSLVLFRAGSKTVAQIRYGEFNDAGNAWIMKYINLKNANFNSDGEFHSDGYGGEFAIYKNGNTEIRGLKIYDSWSGVADKGEYEIGRKIGVLKDEFLGKYIQASTKLLTDSDLKSLSKSELKIMRNEIFARYSYKFIKGGAMDSYFRKQDWYRPQHSNVDDFLTWLEKKNIKTIQAEERNR